VITPGGDFLFGESTSQTTYAGDLAIGRYFTPHDVPFGDLVFYANCNFIVPLEDGGRPTYVGVGPRQRGSRSPATGGSCITGSSPLVGTAKPFDYFMQTAVVKAW